MAKGTLKWQFPDRQGGQGGGFNEGGIDKFKQFKSLTREGVQNPLDQWDESTGEPCTVEFILDDYNPSDFFIDKNYKDIMKACQKHDAKAANKGDGIEFYNGALTRLRNKKITALSVRDYNTNGLPDNPHDITSSYYRLIVAPGTSVSTGRGGGSHGHGQKATFAQSMLRTVFYYSYVDKGIKSLNSKELFIGKTIFNGWVDKDGIDKQPVGYYSDLWINPKKKRDIKSFPLVKNDIPGNIRRTSENGKKSLTGTDIYILEPKVPRNWMDQIERDVVTNFFGAIEHGILKVGVQNKGKDIEYIEKGNLDMYVLKHLSEAEHYLKALRKPINGKPFTKKINYLGTVKLYISRHENANQKIALLRRPRMLIKSYERRVLSNFSGVLLIDDVKGNENLRLAENPRHDKIQKNLMHEHFDEHVDFIDDLFKFIDETIEELKGSTVHEKLNVPGLGNLLPGNKPKDDRGESESDNPDNVPTKIVLKADVKKISKVKLNPSSVPKNREVDNVVEDKEGDTTHFGKDNLIQKLSGAFRSGKDKKIGLIPGKNLNMRSYFINKDGNETKYYVKTEFVHDSQGYLAFTFFGDDGIKVKPRITSLKYLDDSPIKPDYKIKSSHITFDDLKKGDIMTFELAVNEIMPAALGLEG